jgi:hypothetical protein
VRLKEWAGLCSKEINEILQFHVQFASMMAERFDDASKSPHDSKYEGPLAETTLAERIRETTGFLSTNVKEMTLEIESFVVTLEKEQVTMQKEKSLVKRILRLLKSLFKAIATIFTTLSASVSDTDRHHPDPKIRENRLANTTLGQAAFEFGRADSGTFLEHCNPPPARTEVIDPFMQNPRKGKSLRPSTKQFYSSRTLFPRKQRTPKRN